RQRQSAPLIPLGIAPSYCHAEGDLPLGAINSVANRSDRSEGLGRIRSWLTRGLHLPRQSIRLGPIEARMVARIRESRPASARGPIIPGVADLAAHSRFRANANTDQLRP